MEAQHYQDLITAINQLTAVIKERLPITIYTKKVLTLEEAAILTGFGKSTLYALTSSNQIPHSKPTGGTLFFDREKLENWMLGNPISTKHDIEQAAKEVARKNPSTGPKIQNKRTR